MRRGPDPIAPDGVRLIAGTPSLSVVDRVVGAFSPRALARRIDARWRARYIDEMHARAAYKAAEKSRLNADWIASNRDAMGQLAGELGTIRARSRWLFRNNPYAKAVSNAFLNYVVGTGFQLQMQVHRIVREVTPDGRDTLRVIDLETWNDYVEAVFGDWAADCDIQAAETSPETFSDVQTLAFRKWLEDGEVLIALVADRARGLRLQFFEPDAFDEARTTGAGGNPVVMGVELDRTTRRPVAYWINSEDPVSRPALGQSTRVPADRVLHVFQRLRPGQVRGLPPLAAVAQRFFDLDEYTEAELIGNRIAACFSVLIESPTGDQIPLMADPDEDYFPKDSNGQRMSNLAPGMFGSLPAGAKVHTVSPQKPGSTFGTFTAYHARAIAGGVEGGISLNTMTRDATGVSYAGGRFVQQMDYQAFRASQAWFARRFCRPILHRWLDLEVLAGRIAAPGYYEDAPGPAYWRRHAWMPAGWSWGINPVQEVTASRESVRAGFTSASDECAALGYDYKTQVRKLSREARIRAQYGVVVTTDPATDAPPPGPTEDPGVTDLEDDPPANPSEMGDMHADTEQESGDA